jgi:FxLD family lantipeptide
MLNATTPLAPDAHVDDQVEDEFDLDVTLVDIADPASLIPATDDGCGSTCGACTTNAA